MKEENTFSVKGLSIYRFRGRSGPRFICQECDEPITDASQALVVYEWDEIEAFVIHKKCDQLKPSNEKLPASYELHTFLAMLLQNVSMDDKQVKRARETAETLMEI